MEATKEPKATNEGNIGVVKPRISSRLRDRAPPRLDLVKSGGVLPIPLLSPLCVAFPPALNIPEKDTVKAPSPLQHSNLGAHNRTPLCENTEARKEETVDNNLFSFLNVKDLGWQQQQTPMVVPSGFTPEVSCSFGGFPLLIKQDL